MEMSKYTQLTHSIFYKRKKELLIKHYIHTYDSENYISCKKRGKKNVLTNFDILLLSNFYISERPKAMRVLISFPSCYPDNFKLQFIYVP